MKTLTTSGPPVIPPIATAAVDFGSGDENNYFVVRGIGVVIDKKKNITFLFVQTTKENKEEKARKLFDYLKAEGFVTGSFGKVKVMVLKRDVL